jgi:hypothetical protein
VLPARSPSEPLGEGAPSQGRELRSARNGGELPGSHVVRHSYRSGAGCTTGFRAEVPEPPGPAFCGNARSSSPRVGPSPSTSPARSSSTCGCLAADDRRGICLAHPPGEVPRTWLRLACARSSLSSPGGRDRAELEAMVNFRSGSDVGAKRGSADRARGSSWALVLTIDLQSGRAEPLRRHRVSPPSDKPPDRGEVGRAARSRCPGRDRIGQPCDAPAATRRSLAISLVTMPASRAPDAEAVLNQASRAGSITRPTVASARSFEPK